MAAISIVTVVMNRTEHLLKSAQAVSNICIHDEHVILDFGSTAPVRREMLPRDDRIKLHRVENSISKWWLTHSYNLAFALASGEYILKLDADILPSQQFFDCLCDQHAKTKAHLMCNRLTLQDWNLHSDLFTTNGLFLCKRTSLEQLRGFNPYIQGWGWDEIDLYSRFFMAGFPASRIPLDGLVLIQHEDDLREHPIGKVDSKSISLPQSKLDELSPTRRMQAQNDKNRHIAVVSIEKGLGWPSLENYAEYYRDTSGLPALPKVELFNAQEKQYLADGLIRQLLRPSRIQHHIWHLMRRFCIGPYTSANAEALLEACNINLSLVS